MTASHIASSILRKLLSRRMPALFTSTSTRPNASTAVLTMRRRALGGGDACRGSATACAAGRLDLVDHLVGRAGARRRCRRARRRGR